jgi:eukaryotic-like serine/threonine-protein kinase
MGVSSDRDEEDSDNETPLSPGQRLDRYELLCPVGEGGMARVWVARLARKYGFEKLVAIKTILQKHATDDRFRAMFLDEARIASRIDHPNVGHIVDLGEEGDVLYLVMEWIEGDTLSRIKRTVDRKSQKFPLGVALRILADTCQGLHAAHELKAPDGSLLGVVHRDVSPQNILVSMSGVAKLIDFGIAKARDRLSGETSTGFFKGKVHYISPEQAMGLPVDRRSDVFSVGAILYHLIVGRPPFERDSQMATLRALSAAEPLPEMPAGIPPEIDDILVRALAHDANARFATAAELGAALERAMTSCNVSATTADVAAFLSVQLVTRSAARRRQIEQALQAAADRELSAPPPVVTGPHPRPSTAGKTVAMDRPPVTPNAIQVVPPPISVPRIEPDVASASGATAGTGVQSVRSVHPRELANGRSGMVLAAAAALGVFAAIGLVLAFLALRARHAAANASTAIPPPSTSAPVAPIAPPTVEPTTETTAAADPAPALSTEDEPAAPTAVTTPPRPVTSSKPITKPATAPTPAKTGKKRIDDGF